MRKQDVVEHEQSGTDIELLVGSQVRRLTGAYLERWWNTGGDSLHLGRTYTPAEQARREQALQEWLERLLARLDHAPHAGPARSDWQRQLAEDTATLCRSALDLDELQTQILLDRDLTGTALEFVRQARAFDPQLSSANIFQASRNIWTVGGLQLLLGCPVCLTPAGLAYSLLYPYSDNLLDDPAVMQVDKVAFNDRFRAALLGHVVTPANRHEEAVLALVRLVESHYPRQAHPAVWSSLLAIHRAQVRSLTLQHGRAAPYEVDVLGLSIEKGGASVLADGYLAAGTLDEDAADQLFGYGVVLQLVDDLQDVEEDMVNGHLTLFTQAARAWRLDGLTDHLLRFAQQVMMAPAPEDSERIRALRDLMGRSAMLLVLDAVARSERLYSPDFVRSTERYSPFRYKALRALRARLRKQRDLLTSWIQHEALAGGDEGLMVERSSGGS